VHISVLNGPNLNLLGIREPHLYGSTRLPEIEQLVRSRAETLGVEISWSQTNHEGELVELVQDLRKNADGALINAAAFTNTSLALRDAFLAVQVPFVEVHLSNIFAREEERQKTLIGDLSVGLISGFGANSYLLGLDAILKHLDFSGA